MTIGPGSRLETYELVAHIGRGGMGDVWLARDLRLDRKVAVKVLPPHLTDDPDRIARFRQEARATSALNDPNVCTIHTLGETDDGRLFIAMEYIDGTTLRQRLASGPTAIPEALDISAQIASGLAAAHTAGVIHRDVKPENVMIRADGLVKILDFGLAKLDPTIVSFELAQSTRTALDTDSGQVMGTIAYMSPEQACGEALDSRTDIFSLGAVLYEMVTGRRAFPGASTAIVLDGILNRIPTSPVRLNANIPPRLEDIISKALEKDCRLRYQTASELRTDLLRLQRDTDPRGAIAARDTSAAAGSRGSRNRNRRSTVALGALMLAAILASVAIGWGLQFLGPRSELQEVQLTTNSSEVPVTAAAISPDGKYLAFADPAGIHLRLIDSGETHTIPSPDIGDINRVAWFPDGSNLAVSGRTATKNARPAIWSLSILGGNPRKVRDDGLEASVSPDGSQIVFVDGERRHVWVMGANGEEPHQVVTSSEAGTFHTPAYWAGGARLAYGRLRLIADKSGIVKPEVSAEWRDREGQTAALVSDSGLRGAVHLPDGRLVYSLVADPALNRDASLWEIDADAPSGLPKGKPRKIRDWPGVSLWQFSSSVDGKRVAFLKMNPQRDVYLADLASGGEPANPRRFTLDESDDFATNWMPDSKTILFTSNRNGTFDIFRQSLDQRTAEAVVTGSDDESGPNAVSPDGAWFYYLFQPKGSRFTPRGNMIMRTAASGGRVKKFKTHLVTSGHCVLDCRRPPVCWWNSTRDEWLFTLLMPCKGRDVSSRAPTWGPTCSVALISRPMVRVWPSLCRRRGGSGSFHSRVRHRLTWRSSAGLSTRVRSTGPPMAPAGICRARLRQAPRAPICSMST